MLKRMCRHFRTVGLAALVSGVIVVYPPNVSAEGMWEKILESFLPFLDELPVQRQLYLCQYDLKELREFVEEEHCFLFRPASPPCQVEYGKVQRAERRYWDQEKLITWGSKCMANAGPFGGLSRYDDNLQELLNLCYILREKYNALKACIRENHVEIALLCRPLRAQFGERDEEADRELEESRRSYESLEGCNG